MALVKPAGKWYGWFTGLFNYKKFGKPGCVARRLISEISNKNSFDFIRGEYKENAHIEQRSGGS
jgi:hypothetical protein